MNKLPIWVIGMVNISAPSFKNLSYKSSFPAALFVPFFKGLRYIWFELFEKLLYFFKDIS